MTRNKKEKAEKAKQNKGVKYLRRFAFSVLSQSPVGLVPVVKRKE